MIASKEKFLAIIALFCLILVGLPRFNGNTFIVKQVPYDAHYFNAYVSYFRGETPAAPIRPMSNSRFLLPLLASALPFSAPTSLNLLNITCIALSLVLLYAILKHLKAEPKQRWIAVFLSIFSFPCFYYMSISYVDSGAILFVCLGVYAWLKENYRLFALAALLGLMAKETSIVLFPFALACSWQQKNYRHVLFLFFGLILFVFLHYLIRLYAPLSAGELRFKSMQFSWGATKNNLVRVNTLLSFIFSLGVPGILFVRKYLLEKTFIFNHTVRAGAWGGLAGILALYLFSFLTTVADGRIIWHAYVFIFILIFERKETNY